jgi:hypothetical protein
MSDVDRLVYLVEEIGILKTRIEERGTGHIRTAINVLNERVSELKEKLNNETK